MSREPHKFEPKRAKRLNHPERREFLPNEKALDLLGLRNVFRQSADTPGRPEAAVSEKALVGNLVNRPLDIVSNLQNTES